MSEQFLDGELVPPEVPNFQEYQYPSGDFAENAHTAMHIFRLAKASLLEQYLQLEDIKADIEHKMSRMRDLLRD